jgi:hypothetical protein
MGAAIFATVPSTSQKPEGPTLAPAGTAAHFIELRSTAGNCFGLFIEFLLFVDDQRSLSELCVLRAIKPRNGSHQERVGCREQPTQID